MNIYSFGKQYSAFLTIHKPFAVGQSNIVSPNFVNTHSMYAHFYSLEDDEPKKTAKAKPHPDLYG